jgi:U6 snRNA-associated Sm-like protein LSm1
MIGPSGIPLPEPPVPGAALAEELDKKLLVQLRDGRKLLGVLRSFDQFANLVLEHSIERIIVGEQYADIPLGLQLIRGENVVLLGEVDQDADAPAGLTRVPEHDIKQAQRAEKEQKQLKASLRWASCKVKLMREGSWCMNICSDLCPGNAGHALTSWMLWNSGRLWRVCLTGCPILQLLDLVQQLYQHKPCQSLPAPSHREGRHAWLYCTGQPS